MSYSSCVPTITVLGTEDAKKKKIKKIMATEIINEVTSLLTPEYLGIMPHLCC